MAINKFSGVAIIVAANGSILIINIALSSTVMKYENITAAVTM